MSVDLRVQRARAAAARLVTYYGIEEPEHISLEDIAYDLGAEIVSGNLEGATARLSRFKDRAMIRVSDRIANVGRKRFSIGHELGHLVQKHPGDLFSCTDDDMHDFGGRSLVETEANAFSSELLLPDTLVRKRCEVSPVNLDVVCVIAELFSTSMTATAIRFVQLTSERCAVVFSKDGVRKWFIKNAEFWPYIQRGVPVSKWSVAHDYFAKGTLSDLCQQVDATAWADENGLGDLEELYEHSMAIPSLNAVLSLLWIPES